MYYICNTSMLQRHDAKVGSCGHGASQEPGLVASLGGRVGHAVDKAGA